MKYYDSNSGKIRNTIEEEFAPTYYNAKAAKVRNIFAAIILPIMAVTVMLQLFWLNIVLHCILCSTIIALAIGMLVCDIIQRDRRNAFTSGTWIFLWITNMVLNLLNHFVW